MYDKILKKKLQYTFSGTVCDVFKGSTHHGALGLSFRLTTLRARATSGCVAPPAGRPRPRGARISEECPQDCLRLETVLLAYDVNQTARIPLLL